MISSLLATLLGIYFGSGELSSLTPFEALGTAFLSLNDGTKVAESVGVLLGIVLPWVVLAVLTWVSVSFHWTKK